MKKLHFIAAALTCLVASTLNADTWNKMTKVTFSGPVQIPGPATSEKVVTLGPGTYVFRLMESSSTRHIVEVTNERQNRVYSTILAIPDYRVNAASKTVMYFSERQAGSPVAIKSWFYPGDNFGQRFVYPKAQATQVAAAINQPVPAHNVQVVERTKIVEVPVYIETPAKQEIAYNAAAFEKQDATDTAGEDGEAVRTPTAAAAPAAEQLPKSGSDVQLLAILGLLVLTTGWLLRRSAFLFR
jgi:LPXTG-motif cell wall-anchored protein